MTLTSAAQQIDAIIKKLGDWWGVTLAELRALITQAAPAVVEEVTWKKPSRPEGVPVWAHGGILCVAETLKQAVRLTFPQGTRYPPQGSNEALQRASGERIRACDRRP